MDTIIQILLKLDLQYEIIKLKHEFYPFFFFFLFFFFSHKCYNSGAITPERINTPYIRCIYGVQSVIARFYSKFRLSSNRLRYCIISKLSTVFPQ